MAYNYFLKEEFLQFCKSGEIGISAGSSSSYASYLGRMKDVFFGYSGFLIGSNNIFDLLPSIVSYDIKNDTDYVNTVITLLYFLPYSTGTLPQKAYRNGKSALAAYLIFAYTDEFRSKAKFEKSCTKGKIESTIKFLQGKVTKMVYGYEIIFANFMARLRTQDRYPVDGVYYPVRVLSKIFNNRSQYVYAKMLRDMVDHILVFTKDKDGSLHVGFVKDVKQMIFDNSFVEVKFRNVNKSFLLITELSGYILYGTGERYALQSGKNNLKGVNIQHKPAIHGELQNKQKYPGLSELKKIIDNLCMQMNIRAVSKNAVVIAKNIDVSKMSEQIKKLIWEDLRKIEGAITLSLMDEKENKVLKDK